MVALLGGCHGGGTIGAGEDMYHGLQGGAIAQQRPPPPGVNDPFPNMGTIPARPAAPNIVEEQRIADQLATQRDQAEATAAANPLTPRAPPPALPKPAAPDPNANHVVVDAAPAPPPVKPAPPAAPVAAPQAVAAAPASPIPTLASVPAVVAPVISGPLPSLAAAPPLPPSGFGLAASTAAPVASQATASTAPVPVAAPAPVPAAPAKSLLDTLLSPTVFPKPKGDSLFTPVPVAVTAAVAVIFTPGSAELPPSATLTLRRFALAHKGVPVTVTGHGEVVLPGADSQSRALDLALRRAQAIAASLSTAGIPPTNLRLHAVAAGHGGTASL